MAEWSHKLLFYVFSFSAYVSPSLMIISITTDYWLFSYEKITITQQYAKITAPTRAGKILNGTATTTPVYNADSIDPSKLLDYIEANFGLWRMCKILDESRTLRCEPIAYFKTGDSETRLTDMLTKQVGNCTIPILIALIIMLLAVFMHSYALFRNHTNRSIFLLSGCLFIIAGLASLTGLIVFIATINGSIDNKLLRPKTKDDEPLFKYNYGISFLCAIFSFTFQELNGICNIYWYIGYYRKYRYLQSATKYQQHIPVVNNAARRQQQQQQQYQLLKIETKSPTKKAANGTPTGTTNNQVTSIQVRDDGEMYYDYEIRKKLYGLYLSNTLCHTSPLISSMAKPTLVTTDVDNRRTAASRKVQFSSNLIINQSTPNLASGNSSDTSMDPTDHEIEIDIKMDEDRHDGGDDKLQNSEKYQEARRKRQSWSRRSAHERRKLFNRTTSV